MMNGTLKVSACHTVGAGLCTLLLSGCSSLQVDVDVYKGPLVNTQEVQLRQYASLVIAAKPLLEHMRYEAAGRLEKCHIDGGDARKKSDEEKGEKAAKDVANRDGSLPIKQNPTHTSSTEDLPIQKCERERFQLVFLCETVALYGTPNLERLITYPASLKLCNNEMSPLPSQGLDALAKALQENLIVNQQYSIEDAKEKREVAVEKLSQEMVTFAQKILFFANNQVLFKELTAKSKGILKTQTAVLQSLGNTILVHANDLQRQKNRRDDFKKQAASGLAALQGAFPVSPSVLFDQIMKDMESVDEPAPEVGVAAGDEGVTGDEAERLTVAKEALTKARVQSVTYLAESKMFLAAYRTLVAEPPKELLVLEFSPAELYAAKADRSAIAEMYAKMTSEQLGDTLDAAVAPLRAWLNLAKVQTALQTKPRQDRIDDAVAFLEARKAELAALQLGPQLSGVEKFAAIQKFHANFIPLLQVNFPEHSEALESALASVVKLEAVVAKAARRKAMPVQTIEAKATSLRETEVTLSLIKPWRDEILAQAIATQVSGADGVIRLLNLKLAKVEAADKGGQKSQIATAKTRIAKLHLQGNPCIVTDTVTTQRRSPAADAAANSCHGEDPIFIIDNLIMSLQMQRVAALARKDSSAASLLVAINAAYEQRTSLIYLRPASDYLRSVYAASTFQDGTLPEHRNMLMDWTNYVGPSNKQSALSGWDPVEGESIWESLDFFGSSSKFGRDQLEKLYWQNINKVSLSGGGATNYVLAKDDVGNWYVKTYGSDPEAIIKSATSLALFSAGKHINTNLLRRGELQRRIDSSKSPTERDELNKELKSTEQEDGASLLKVQARYAVRYREDTRRQISSLHMTLLDLVNMVGRTVETVKIIAPCDPTEAQLRLKTEPAFNAAAFATLEKINAMPAGDEVPIGEMERALQSGLSAFHSYSGQIHVALIKGTETDCGVWRTEAAEKARKVTRDALVAAARERKQSIERYEDALTNIAEVAAQK